MAGSINKLTLVGNLGRDPEVRVTPDGGKVVVLSVATSEHWKDKNTDEKRERTEWHRVVIFNQRLCDISEKYLRKGMKVYVEGPLQTRQWVDAQGKTCRIQEVVIRFKGDLTILDRESRSRDVEQDSGTVSSFPESDPEPSLEEALDDEIPF